MYMIGANETKLDMTVTNQQDREEFPMILKSLEDTLKRSDKHKTEMDNEGIKEIPDQKQKPCQSN